MRILAWLFATFAVLNAAEEPTLANLAATTVIRSPLCAESSQPDTACWPPGKAMTVTSLGMRTTLWGPPERPTISLMRNDVWDRRRNPAPAPTLAEITAGAFAPANRAWVNPTEATKSRPTSLGWLTTAGGYWDPYRQPFKYPFPCPKPVGQIILLLEDLAGAEVPVVEQRCADGVTTTHYAMGGASARLEYVLGMTSGTCALRGTVAGLTRPARLRLYRHRDTSHQKYMDAAGTTYTVPEAAAGAAWNGPIAAPESGQDGRHFWIRQTLPADPTFPNGFTYVMMGRILTPARIATADAVTNQTGLGTPPPTELIAKAPGAAATATIQPGADGRFEATVVIVTSIDAADPLAEAHRRLEAAPDFAAVQAENRAWYQDFYAQREQTRVIAPDGWPGESVAEVYRSWSIAHGGGTRTDLRRFQSSAHYAAPDVDNQPWNGMPCYNEIFYTYRYVHGWTDAVDMWKQIVAHCQAAAERNAREMFDLPGMCLTHGYQPPTKADKVLHTAIALELCLGTMGQLLRPLWDEWDYGGDLRVLQNEVYPPLKQAAIFSAAFTKLGEDGHRHVAPCVIEECWGIYPEFRRNRDGITTLCMFRWNLDRAAEAADLLGVDANLAREWRTVARELAPNPTWESPQGTVLTGLPGLPNHRYGDDHPWDPALAPIELADEITLDSADALRALGLRTAALWRTPSSTHVELLLGRPIDRSHAVAPGQTAEALLNSRGGVLHLFPAVPANATLAFRGFQAQGGFRVSAARTAAGVSTVDITARRTLPCIIADAWPGRAVEVTGDGKPVVVTRNDGRLQFAATAGATYRLMPVTPPTGR